MRKILSGLLGIVLTAGVVGGVAYAQFVSPAASVQGVTFSAGNADLKVWDGDSYETFFNVPWTFTNLYPGFTASPTNFWLQNQSTAPIGLDIKGTLRSGVTGDWDAWKDNVEVAMTETGIPPVGGDWHTLNAWFTTGFALPGGSLLQNAQRQYDFHVRVINSATGIENLTLSGVNFDFVGTQTP